MTLELRDVTLTFEDGDRSVEAVSHVDLLVEPGEFLVVTGPSGSGKSSLLAVAGLLTVPTSGEVLIDGFTTADLSPSARSEIRRRDIAFVFQTAGLFPALTAREQLEFVLHMRGELDDSGRRKAMELLESVGLAARADHRPSKLSGGERQRVALARALMTEPDVLLVDEPTAALDEGHSREVMDLIGAATFQLKTATVLVTHDLDNIDLCDRRVEMRDGRLTGGALAD